jgi:hypothetical protein
VPEILIGLIVAVIAFVKFVGPDLVGPADH